MNPSSIRRVVRNDVLRNDAEVDSRPIVTIEINRDHILSHLCELKEPLVLGEYGSFKSIEQILYSCLFAQHNMFSEVHNFWARNTEVVSDPSEIRKEALTMLSERNVEVSAQWLFNLKKVLCRIFLTFLRNPDLHPAFRRQMERRNDDEKKIGVNINFVVTTNSDSERTMSCGHRMNKLPKLKPGVLYAGSNVAGEALKDAFEIFYGGPKDFDFPYLDALLSQSVFPRTGYQKTAVLLSDSTFGRASWIEGGDIWYKTGLTCSELAERVVRKHGNLLNYKVVIVAAGTNDSNKLRTRDEQECSWYQLYELLKPLRNHPYSEVVIHTGIGVRHWTSLRSYVRNFFRPAFVRDFGDCENFHLIDWTTVSDNNVFLNPDGSDNHEYLHKDQYGRRLHANVKGTRRMWRYMLERVPSLKAVQFSTSHTPYSVPTLDDLQSLI